MANNNENTKPEKEAMENIVEETRPEEETVQE